MFKLPISMAETAELVERTVTIRTAMKIEIDQIVFIKTSVEVQSFKNNRQGVGQHDIRTKCLMIRWFL
jgi:hypothetical protein